MAPSKCGMIGNTHVRHEEEHKSDLQRVDSHSGARGFFAVLIAVPKS